MQVQTAQREATLGKRAYEMHRQETAPELYHLRTVDGRLQPGAVMECRIPIVDGRVVPAEGDLQMVVLLESYDASLDLHVESGGGRGSRARIRACCKAQLAEEAYSLGESGTEMKNELPFVKPALAAFLSRRGKIYVAKPGNMQGRVSRLCRLRSDFVIGVLHAAHA